MLQATVPLEMAVAMGIAHATAQHAGIKAVAAAAVHSSTRAASGNTYSLADGCSAVPVHKQHSPLGKSFCGISLTSSARTAQSFSSKHGLPVHSEGLGSLHTIQQHGASCSCSRCRTKFMSVSTRSAAACMSLRGFAASAAEGGSSTSSGDGGQVRSQPSYCYAMRFTRPWCVTYTWQDVWLGPPVVMLVFCTSQTLMCCAPHLACLVCSKFIAIRYASHALCACWTYIFSVLWLLPTGMHGCAQ